MTTTVIVLAFNNGERLTLPCVDSILANTDPDLYDLLVFDNGSTDKTCDLIRAKHVDVARLEENVGFSVGNNIAATFAQGENLVFLNNDIVAHPGWLEPMLAALEQPGVGMVGSKLLYPDGRIQHAGVHFESNPNGALYGLHYQSEQPPGPVHAVTAACMAMRADLFHQLDGFDPAYRLGNEDVDLAFKVRDAGWTIWYEPASLLTHHESQSPDRFDHVRENVTLFTQRWLHRTDLWREPIGARV